MEITASKEVQITSVLFQQDGNQIKFVSIPKYIIYKGKRYALVQN